MSEAEWHRRGAHDRSRPTARSCRHGNRKQVPAASDGRSGRDTHGWPLPQTTGRPSAASAPSRHCAFGSYRHRHRQVAGLARAAINQTTGSGAGTIRAMSTAEMPAGEVVSPSARCARLRQQVPLRASSPRVAASRCTPLPRAPASAHCAHLRPLIIAVPTSRLPPALRSPRAADAAGQASCARVTDDDPMSWRRLATRCAHRMPTVLPSVAAATNARAFVLRPRRAHAPSRRRRRYRHGPAPGACAIREGVFAQRRRGRGAHRCAGPALPSNR